MTQSTVVKTDPPGTCHLVGCEGKGVHAPHSLPIKGIGAGSWEDYKKTDTCLGFPQVKATNTGLLQAICSLGGSWETNPRLTVDPKIMGEWVDDHKVGCDHRQATPV